MAKDKQPSENALGSRLRDDVTKIFDCFMIVNRPSTDENGPTTEFIFPNDFNDKEVIQQSILFCFPFHSGAGTSLEKNAYHYTFILTDIEGKHRFGFCKLTNNATKCYCLLSFMPWFEIFYKILNFVHELSDQQSDVQLTMLHNLYNEPIPTAQQTFRLNTSLVLSPPDFSSLPSIPENRNLSEYYSNVNTGFMMDMFTSLMFERRVLFTSSNLSTLTSCVHGAEALLRPLHWQHIFIPVMPAHLLDYCLAPMPYLVGVHSSLMPKVRDMIATDCDIIVADIDKEEIESIHNDMDNMPNDVISFLKSLLRKTTIVVGTNLAMAFLRAQARLIGGYRDGLKFRPGEAIVFDDDLFIESFKTSTGREYAKTLMQLQSFKQFVDGRLEMLNGGVGFRDHFENEVNVIDAAKGNNRETYKEWLISAKKGGNELFMQFKKKAKGNMKVARQTFQNVIKQPDKSIAAQTKEQKMLDEAPHRIRPSRPPARPPPPDPSKLEEISTTRRYKPLNLDEVDGETPSEVSDPVEKTERSMSDAFNRVEVDLVSDMTEAMNRITNNSTDHNEETPDLLDFSQDVVATNTMVSNEAWKRKPSPKPQRNASLIRRSAHVIARPSLKIQPKMDDLYSSDDRTPSPSNTLESNILLMDVPISSDQNSSTLVDFPTNTEAKTSTPASADLLGLDIFTSSPFNSNSNNWVQFNDGNTDVVSTNSEPATSDQKMVGESVSSNSIDTLFNSDTNLHHTPNKLSPEKLNPFIAINTSNTTSHSTTTSYTSTAFNQQPNYYSNSHSHLSLNRSSSTPLHSVNNPFATLPQTCAPAIHPKPNFVWTRGQNTSKSLNQNWSSSNNGLQRSSTVQPRRSNNAERELFADVLSTWKKREGL